jgi:hypothetical protein
MCNQTCPCETSLRLQAAWKQSLALAGLFLCVALATSRPASATDQLGNAVLNQVSCASVKASQGVPDSTCFKGIVSCPGVSDIPAALKVNQPRGLSTGTVLFTIGGGGNAWYDVHFTFGARAIQDVVSAGYTTVQFDFAFAPLGQGNAPFAGWLTGPGGPRALACRWATLAQWVHDNLREADAPFCATGNSAAAAAAGYALANYGMGPQFNMLEETSGPPFTDIANGCLCNAPNVPLPCAGGSHSECYRREAQVFLDPSYDNKSCSQAEKVHHSRFKQIFEHDSLDSSDALRDFPNTDIHFVFGGQDTSPGAAQGAAWVPMITGKGTPTLDCVADAPHELADVLDGATKIADDIINFCH